MNAHDTQPFEDAGARALWDRYLRKVDALCTVLNPRQRADIQTELKAHLLEGFIQTDAADEAARLAAVIEKLGEPDEFVPSWVEERLLDDAQPGAGARSLFGLLRTNLARGVKQFPFTMLVGLGYLLSFYFFLIALMKLVFPKNVGLYLTPAGIPVLGYVDADAFREILGYWLTPVALIASILLQILLSRWIRRRFSKRA